MHKLINFLFLFIFCSSVIAQELNEQQIAITRNIQELLISHPEQAYAVAQKASTSKDEWFGFYGQYYIANYHYNKSEFTHSKQLLISLIDSLEKSKYTKSSKGYQDFMGMCVNKLFYIHKNLGEYDMALFYLDKYKKSVPNQSFNEQYGLVKVALGDYVNGIALLKKELETSPHLQLGKGEKKAMNKKLFADKYNIIGEAYQQYYIQSKDKTVLDSANYYFTTAANMLLKDQFQPEYTKALLSMRLAKSAALSGDYAKSLSYYRKRNTYPIIKEHIRTEQSFDLGMADCFHHLKQIDSALLYCNKYIKNYQITKVSKENLLIAYTIMSQCYREKNDDKNAYAYAQKSLELIQSIEGIKSKSLNFLHNYDLNSIKAESNSIIKSKNYFKISLFSILLVLAIVIFSFYYYYKQQKEKHYRFLKIIQNLKESKAVTTTHLPMDKTETSSKQSIDEELVEKLTVGLKKLEDKESFLDHNFKLAFVAKKLNTNTAYLSHYFNQVLQKTFSEYTQELRIQYVLQKLNDATYFRKYTLQAIAEEVGYKDANTFVRVFKKQTGLSPNYYIEQLEKER